MDHAYLHQRTKQPKEDPECLNAYTSEVESTTILQDTINRIRPQCTMALAIWGSVGVCAWLELEHPEVLHAFLVPADHEAVVACSAAKRHMYVPDRGRGGAI